ncbi:MAG: DUF58 domain-containing protein [Azonexus sp.]
MTLLARLQQALFRWRSDGSAPLRLGQRRIFIVPSRPGLFFALALIIMLIGAINYNLALGHALVFLLAGLGIVGMIHTFRNLHDLVVTPGHPEPVFAGETARFPLTLDNERKAPRPGLELEAEGGPVVEAAIAGESRITLRLPLPARQRGWLPLPRVHLSTRYPLGLFTAWAYLQPDMRCLIYPAPINTPLPEPSLAQSGSTRQGEGGDEDFAGFRERQPADPLHHVAWKASARQGDNAPLLIKRFAGGGQSELQLDWAHTDPTLPTETRLGILAGWVLAADAAGLRYGLDLPGCNHAPATGEHHRQACLKALALYQP